jgi:hypothetical protein
MSSQDWCAVCCTRHELGPRCPGEVLATAPERFGWRIQVGGKQHTEQYAVLVAPAGELWRARIVTLPNMLWTVPRGRGTMKFLGHSAGEAERHARNYVMELCKAKGYRAMELDSNPNAGSIGREGASDGAKDDEDRRYLHSVPVRFGIERAEISARTADLSLRGLFIVSKRPLPKETRIKLVVELENMSLPMNGSVAWIRLQPEEGRQTGMGIQLISPPAIYQHYVRRLG